jgi:hypothetical protein
MTSKPEIERIAWLKKGLHDLSAFGVTAWHYRRPGESRTLCGAVVPANLRRRDPGEDAPICKRCVVRLASYGRPSAGLKIGAQPARAEIAAATEQFLAGGGRITRIEQMSYDDLLGPVGQQWLKERPHG